MVTDEQVRRLRKLSNTEGNQEIAATKAGMDEAIPPLIESALIRRKDGLSAADFVMVAGVNGGVIIDHEAPRERRFVAVEK